MVSEDAPMEDEQVINPELANIRCDYLGQEDQSLPTAGRSLPRPADSRRPASGVAKCGT